MSNDIVNAGYNMAMDIVQTYRPKFWQKKSYKNLQYYEIEVHENSAEFREVSQDVEYGQDAWDCSEYDDINAIVRIQNPYTYARFMLRKKQLDMNYDVYEFRKFKYIGMDAIDLALKYNCDGRRFGNDSSDHIFYSTIPNVHEGNALLVVKVLSTDEDDEDQKIECETDSEFYIEYVVYFD